MEENAAYTDANGRLWSPTPSSKHNVLIESRPPTGPTEFGRSFELRKPSSALQLFLDNELVEQIVSATNAKADSFTRKCAEAADALEPNLSNEQLREWFRLYKDVLYKQTRQQLRSAHVLNSQQHEKIVARLRENSRWRRIDGVEILSFIGMHLLLGVRHDRRTSLKDIFASRGAALLSFPAVITAMSLVRFKQITRHLAFVSQERERALVNENSRIAKISDAYQHVLLRFQNAYHPAKELAVDEQLLGFRGRFVARMYMPKKPDKVGIKQWLLVDSNLYTFNMQIYTANEGFRVAGKERQQAARVVHDMITPLPGTGYEITHDRFFTRLSTVERALRRGVTCLGTMRIDSKDMPPALKTRNREVGSSLYAYSDSYTILSYCAKPNKIVPLLSSRHPRENGTPPNATHAEILESNRFGKKPRMILDYNSTKGLVDTIDKEVKDYTAVRKSNKWYHPVWWRLVDTCAKNAEVLINWRRREEGLRELSRRSILQDMGMELIRENATRRYYDQRVSVELRRLIARIHCIEVRDNAARPTTDRGVSASRKRCQFCPRGTNNKSRYSCNECELYVCRKHAIISISSLCHECAQTVDVE